MGLFHFHAVIEHIGLSHGPYGNPGAVMNPPHFPGTTLWKSRGPPPPSRASSASASSCLRKRQGHGQSAQSRSIRSVRTTSRACPSTTSAAVAAEAGEREAANPLQGEPWRCGPRQLWAERRSIPRQVGRRPCSRLQTSQTRLSTAPAKTRLIRNRPAASVNTMRVRRRGRDDAIWKRSCARESGRKVYDLRRSGSFPGRDGAASQACVRPSSVVSLSIQRPSAGAPSRSCRASST